MRSERPLTPVWLALFGASSTGAPGMYAGMVLEELRRLVTWSERHRRLAARVLIAFALSLVVDFAGALLMWHFEIGDFGNALFFVTAQILTVSSSMKNPVTHAGQVVDVGLE